MTAAVLIKNGGGFINLGHWTVGGGVWSGHRDRGLLRRPHRSGDLGHC